MALRRQNSRVTCHPRPTMKAAILPAFGQPLSLEDLPRPVPEADEVLIAVEACGVCHSDLHIADGDMPGFRAAAKPRLILGHEVVGRVVERGAAVTALARELGAAHAIDVRGADAIKQVKALGGLHVAVVTSAAKPAYDMALKCLRPTGTLAVVGLPPEPLTFPALALVGPEVRIVAAA